MRKTTIVGPDGATTTIVTRGGCGLSGCVTWFVVLFVLAAPAAYFGPWAIAAYVFLAAVFGLAMYGMHLRNAKPKPMQPWGAAPPPPPPPPPMPRSHGGKLPGMLALTVQVNGDPTIAWLTGVVAGGTVLLALATFVLALQTRTSVTEAGKVANAAKEEADATLALVREARRDRDLAVQPVLVLGKEQAGGAGFRPGVQLRNIGRGPAIRTRVFLWAGGDVLWNPGPGFHVASGEAYPPPTVSIAIPCLPLDEQQSADSVTDIPGSEHPMADLLAICLDQLGNALMFNLRTGNPPVLSRPSDPDRPTWATAASDTYSTVQPPDEPPTPWVAYV